jgi:hypothetical protein
MHGIVASCFLLYSVALNETVLLLLDRLCLCIVPTANAIVPYSHSQVRSNLAQLFRRFRCVRSRMSSARSKLLLSSSQALSLTPTRHPEHTYKVYLCGGCTPMGHIF